MTIERREREQYYHEAVEVGGTIYLAGVVADDLSLDMRGQTRQALANLEDVLKRVGSDKTKVVMATAYITDFASKPSMNEAWLEFFPPEHLPARATIGVADLGEGVLIEIVCTAVR